MLNLIIADDELPVREAFSQLIDWESNGIVLCGVASNGGEALELVERHRPDLLLTDIKMPVMDGLQLIKAIQEKGFATLPLLLSGYNDFHLVKRALQLGAFDYILKPCHPDDVLKAVLRAKEAAIAERERKRLSGIRESQWRQNLPLAKIQLLSEWLRHPESPWEKRLDKAREMNIRLSGEGLCLATIRPDLKRGGSHSHAAHDRELVLYAALNIAQETLESFGEQGEAFRDDDDMILVWRDTEKDRRLIRAKLARIQFNIRHFLKFSTTVGVCDEPTSLRELNEAYTKACRALELSFFQGQGDIYFYSADIETEAKRQNPGHAAQIEELERSLPGLLKEGRYSDVIDGLDQWFSSFKDGDSPDRSEIHVRTLALMSRLLQEAGASADEDGYEPFLKLADGMLRAESVDELLAVTTQIIQKLAERRNAIRPIHRTIALAVGIIKENYSSNLTLKAVAEEVYLSPSYLSTLFKQEMGIKYIDYLHQYRIEAAKPLLREGHLKVSVVAARVGYADEAHFIHTFKKWTGMSPAAYAKYGGEARPERNDEH